MHQAGVLHKLPTSNSWIASEYYLVLFALSLPIEEIFWTVNSHKCACVVLARPRVYNQSVSLNISSNFVPDCSLEIKKTVPAARACSVGSDKQMTLHRQHDRRCKSSNSAKGSAFSWASLCSLTWGGAVECLGDRCHRLAPVWPALTSWCQPCNEIWGC